MIGRKIIKNLKLSQHLIFQRQINKKSFNNLICKLNFNFTIFNAHGEQIDTISYRAAINEIYGNFFMLLEKNLGDKNFMVETLDLLNGCKMGISQNDIQFIKFMEGFVQSFEYIYDIEELISIATLYNKQECIQSPVFWTSFHNKFKKLYDRMDLRQCTIFVDLMCQNIQKEYLKKVLEYYNILLKNSDSSEMQILDLLKVINILELQNLESTAQKQVFRNKILQKKDEIIGTFDSNTLSDIGILIYKLYSRNDEEMMKLLKKIPDAFINKDLMEYDKMLQEYEFQEEKMYEIGVQDNLMWRSLANIAIILGDELFLDEMMIKRLEDAIFRKSETDIVDIQSTTVIMQALINYDCTDPAIYMRLIEMIQMQMKEEGFNFLLKIKDGKQICILLETAAYISKNVHVDQPLIKQLFVYFQNAFNEKKIDDKLMTPILYERLFYTYTNMKFALEFKDFLKQIQKNF